MAQLFPGLIDEAGLEHFVWALAIPNTRQAVRRSSRFLALKSDPLPPHNLLRQVCKNLCDRRNCAAIQIAPQPSPAG